MNSANFIWISVLSRASPWKYASARPIGYRWHYPIGGEAHGQKRKFRHCRRQARCLVSKRLLLAEKKRRASDEIEKAVGPSVFPGAMEQPRGGWQQICGSGSGGGRRFFTNLPDL